MMARYASKLCPIFRADDEKIYDLPITGTGKLAGSISFTTPQISGWGETTTYVVSVSGITIGDGVIVTCQTSQPESVKFHRVTTDVTDKLTFEFFQSSSSCTNAQMKEVKFLWRKINI